MTCRPSDSQSVAIGKILFDIAVGHFFRRDPLLLGFGDDFIVHIRKVLNIGDLVSSVLQVSPHGIKYNHGAGVADVYVIVYRWAADVHFDLFIFLGLKIFQLA